MTSIEATAARDELVDLTLAPIPLAERPSRWSVQTAQQAIAYAATQEAVELAYLLDLIRDERPMTILEVGTWLGGTLWAWGQAAPAGATLISVDRDQSQRRVGRDDQTIEVVEGDSGSEATRDRVAEYAPYGLDFVFIDADHHFDAVKRDHELYEPLVRAGGIVAFHDIVPVPRDPVEADVIEVDRFWQLIRPRDAWEWSYAGDRFGIGAYRKDAGA